MNIRNANTISPAHSEHGEVVYEFFGTAAGGSQGHSLAQIVVPPGKASLKHYHPVAEESYYILAGQGRLVIDGETTLVGPGDAAIILPRQIHQILNDTDTDLVLLAVCVPPWTPDNTIVVE